jgi:hypothetical protein
LALSLALCQAGCGSRYARDRLADFVDVFDMELGFGPGLDVRGRASCIGTGLGVSKQRVLAWHGRQFGFAERAAAGVLLASVTEVREESYSLGTLGRAPAEYDEHCAHRHDLKCLLSLAHWEDDRQAHVPSHESAQSNLWPPHWWQALDAEFGGAFGVVGLHVGISPGQLLDFLLGWTTLDIVGDDLAPQPPKPAKPEPSQRPERPRVTERARGM